MKDRVKRKYEKEKGRTGIQAVAAYYFAGYVFYRTAGAVYIKAELA